MKKIAGTIMIILGIASLLCGCGKKEDVITNLSYAEYAYDLQYDYLNSEQTYQFNLATTDALDIDVTCTEGSLDVKVVNIDNAEIYHEELLVSKDITVSVPENGRYIIIMTGKKTTGGIRMEVVDAE